MYSIKVHPIVYPQFDTKTKEREPEYVKYKKEESKDFKKTLESHLQAKHSILDIRI